MDRNGVGHFCHKRPAWFLVLIITKCQAESFYSHWF